MDGNTYGNTTTPDELATTADLTRIAGSGGVVWSVSPDGFHANLVVLDAGQRIERHRNDEVDVLFVTLAGSAVLTVDDVVTALDAGTATLVPRGTHRSVAANSAGVRYLTVHAQRRPLTIGRADV
jgi:quercetin dioxygenase-like cupin family protein